MPGCTVPNCSNSIEKGFKLFHFPSNHERRALWAKKCGRDKDWKPTRNICICEVHFEESQFELNADNLRKLKPNAVPTVFNDAIPAFYRREKSNGEHENTNHTPVTQVTLKQRKNDTNITTLPSDVSPNVSKKTKLENNIKKGENEKMGRNVSTDVSSVTHTVHKSQLNNQISSSKDVKTKTGLDEHTSLLSKNLSGSVSQITDSENEKTNQAPGLQISMRHRKKDKNNSTIHINVSPSGTKITNQTQGLQKTLRQTRNDKNTLSADVPTIVSKTPGLQKTTGQRKKVKNTTTKSTDVPPCVLKVRKLIKDYEKSKNRKKNSNVSTHVSSITRTLNKSARNKQIPVSKDFEATVSKKKTEKHDGSFIKASSYHVSGTSDQKNESTNQKPGLQKTSRKRKNVTNTSTMPIDVPPSVSKVRKLEKRLERSEERNKNVATDVPSIHTVLQSQISNQIPLSKDVKTTVSKHKMEKNAGLLITDPLLLFYDTPDQDNECINQTPGLQKTTEQRKKVKNTTTESTDVPPCVLKVRKLIKDYEKSKNRKKNSNVSTHVSSITRTLNKSARNKQIPVSKDFEATVSKKKTEKHDGSFIKASSYHVSGTSDQKNENTNQAQELQRTSRHMKNDKNTTTLPADLSTSISKKRKLERNTKRKRREERNRNLSTDVSSITHTVHKSQIKNKISLTKEIKIILPKIQMGKHSSLLIKDSSQHISETSDLANETREDLQSSNGENICFVCNSRNQNIVPNNACTETSKTELKQKLVLLVSVELDLRLEDIGLICVNCAQILNCIDYVENMHKTLSKGILNHVKRNFGMEPTEHVNLDLCMRQIQAQSEAKIKYVGNLRGPAQSSI